MLASSAFSSKGLGTKSWRRSHYTFLRGGHDENNLNTHDEDNINNINNDTDIPAQTANSKPTQTQTPNPSTLAEVFSTFPIQPRIQLPSSTSNKPPKYALVIVDNFCPYHGGYISNRARTVYGAAVIQQLSNYMSGYLLQQHNQTSHLQARLPLTRDQMKTWLEAIHHELGNSVTILAVYCESDAGLDETESFAQLLSEHCTSLSHNTYNPSRRHKYLMNEALERAGMSIVKQQLCESIQQAKQFCIKELGMSIDNVLSNNNYKSCIVKPFRGVGSDKVYLCNTIKQVENAFNAVHGQRIFDSISADPATGLANHVLLQECALGQEYAIDVVSRDGQHVVAAAWKYDKRSVNGAPFVYYSTTLCDLNTDPACKLACEYTLNALNALQVRFGLTHTEIKVDDQTGIAKLIEVNCRQHNIDLVPLTTMCIGYNALDMLVSAYFDKVVEPLLTPEQDPMLVNWNDLPTLPTLQAHGAVVHLVCSVSGRVTSHQHFDEIENLDSFVAMDIYDNFSVGQIVSPTIDIKTDAGWVHLVNDDPVQFDQDYKRIVELMPHLFEVE